MNYLVYPFKTMRITQSYTGKTSHYPHTIGNIKDYPIDEGGADTGRDWFYCNCDELVIKRIYGVGTSGVNTMWLESTSKVEFADGSKDYCVQLLTHPNDSDLKRLKTGQKFKRGEKICQEGTDGASGNHIHLSVGKGKIKGNGWEKNNKGKYVLTTTGGTLKPQEAYFIDPSFTKVISSAGIGFRDLPKYTPGNYKVVENAPVRVDAGTSYAKKDFDLFTKDAQKQIIKLKGKEVNYFVKGMKFTAKKVEFDGSHWWGNCPSGWVCLEHCKKI